MKLTRLQIILLALSLGFLAQGQQDIQLSQQTFSKINMNPAATGFSNYANAYLFARQQWVGFESAPSTQMFNVQGYINEIRSGFGLSVFNDRIGKNNLFSFMFAYAYHVKIDEQKYFSLGLSAGLFNRRYGGNVIVEEPEIDPDIRDMLVNGKRLYRPDIDLGATYSTSKLSIGLSATHLTHYLFKDDWFNLPLCVYLFAEYGFDFNEKYRFTPRVQVMGSSSSKKNSELELLKKFDILYEFGGTFAIKDKFWIGAAFRMNDALVGLVGLNLNPNFRIGYSYDFKLGQSFQNVKTYGSHEIMLNYRMKLFEDEHSEQTPRFFD